MYVVYPYYYYYRFWLSGPNWESKNASVASPRKFIKIIEEILKYQENIEVYGASTLAKNVSNASKLC